MRNLENPFPYLIEAADAARKAAALQRDVAVLSAELRARIEARRAASIVGALISLNVLVTLTLFWITMGLHDSGWNPFLIALPSFGVFGALAALLGWLALTAGKRKAAPP